MTGVSTSNLTALAWMSSIWGWRYESEAKAYNQYVESINPGALFIRDPLARPSS